jgi:ribosomal protein S18 acetylase RimI-like enzyme
MYVIDSATVADIPALCDLLAVLFAQEQEFQPHRARQQLGLQLLLQQPEHGCILLARSAQAVIGMVGLQYLISTALGGRAAILEDLVVTPTMRGRGVGSALLTAAIEQARADNCLRISLLTDGDNRIAQQFYRKHGFSLSEMKTVRLLLPDPGRLSV